MRLAGLRFRPDRPLLARPQIAPVDVPILRLRVDDPRLHHVDRRIKAVPAVNHLPILVHNPVARQRLDRPAPTPVVLQASADVIRLFVVEPHFIELTDRDGVDEVPGFPRVIAPVDAAVGPRNHVIRIRRIDPHRVIIAVNSVHALR